MHCFVLFFSKWEPPNSHEQKKRHRLQCTDFHASCCWIKPAQETVSQLSFSQVIITEKNKSSPVLKTLMFLMCPQPRRVRNPEIQLFFCKRTMSLARLWQSLWRLYSFSEVSYSLSYVTSASLPFWNQSFPNFRKNLLIPNPSRHLNRDHSTDEKTIAQWRVQRDLVRHMENQVQQRYNLIWKGTHNWHKSHFASLIIISYHEWGTRKWIMVSLVLSHSVWTQKNQTSR